MQLCNFQFSKKEDDEVYVERPKIHESVFKRIANRSHAYAPIGLPASYDVVTDGGEILTPNQFGFETSDEAMARSKAQEYIWNDIWKRRIVYFATVGATLYLLAYPLLRAAPRSDEFTSPIRWLSDIIRFIGGFLPSFAGTWINGFARSPIQFAVLLGVVIGFIYLGTVIASRIADRMGAIWSRQKTAPSGLPNNWIYRLRSNPHYIGLHEGLKYKWAPAFFAILFTYLGLTFASHLLYNVQDVAGLVCREDGTAKGLARGEQAVASFATSSLCNRTGILIEGRGATYVVKVEATSPWKDGGIPAPIGGFYTTQAPSLYQRALLALGVPLRRELIRPWFRVVLRYGATGGEEVFLDPDPDSGKIEIPIKPTRSGELFVFVNDAVIGIPGLYDAFYRNNAGEALLTVKRR